MSEIQKDSEQTRKRRVGRVRKPRAEGEAAATPAAPREKVERAPRPPRVSVPVPAELFGKIATGRIDGVINGGRSKYGFITINDTEARIYFSVTNFDSSEFTARRGYEVEFLVSKDESDRANATNVKLTAGGKVQAAEREAKIVADKAVAPREKKAAAVPAAAAAAGAEAGERKKRVRAPRERPEDDRSISLQVHCVGKTEVKTVVAKLSQSIGKLKHAATEAFEVSPTLNVFVNVTAENAQGVLLSKALLRALNDNDAVYLREPAPATA